VALIGPELFPHWTRPDKPDKPATSLTSEGSRNGGEGDERQPKLRGSVNFSGGNGHKAVLLLSCEVELHLVRNQALKEQLPPYAKLLWQIASQIPTTGSDDATQSTVGETTATYWAEEVDRFNFDGEAGNFRGTATVEPSSLEGCSKLVVTAILNLTDDQVPPDLSNLLLKFLSLIPDSTVRNKTLLLRFNSALDTAFLAATEAAVASNGAPAEEEAPQAEAAPAQPATVAAPKAATRTAAPRAPTKAKGVLVTPKAAAASDGKKSSARSGGFSGIIAQAADKAGWTPAGGNLTGKVSNASEKYFKTKQPKDVQVWIDGVHYTFRMTWTMSGFLLWKKADVWIAEYVGPVEEEKAPEPSPPAEPVS